MIPVCEPNLTGKEQEYVADAIASGWVSGGGPYVERFEEMVAKACGKRWCVATTTGTAALHTAMTALGFHGRIKMPDYTFVAAKNVIETMGGTPEFDEVGDRINHDDSRIYMADTKWPMLVDSAPAVGTGLDPWGSLWTLSFNGNKTVTAGQGGAIVGDDYNMHCYARELVKQKRVHGGKFNYGMANINAALGCAQMERLEEFLAKKWAIRDRYSDAGLDMLQAGNSRWMSLYRCGQNTELYIEKLNECGIEARLLWNYLTKAAQPYEAKKENRWICLPCSTNLTEEDQDKVIKCVASL